ncbi:MAG: hypothetical protein KME23_27325 [Goleter apudmare HA4340-LM2]|nr:hypothetical protein [Goleter apudmare HA4340-LM2]
MAVWQCLDALGALPRRVAIARVTADDFLYGKNTTSQKVRLSLDDILAVKCATQSPSKNENVLKSVTIRGLVCKRENICNQVALLRHLATNPCRTR